MTFQPITAKQSPIEISDCRLDNVLFYNRQSQSAANRNQWIIAI